MTNDFSIDQNNTSKIVEGADDIKQCWANILFTIPGAIPLMPEFGCNLFAYIDKPTTESFGSERNDIIKALEKWEPRAKINKCTRTIEGSTVFINLFGTDKSTGESIVSKVNLSTVFNNYKDENGNWNKNDAHLYYITVLNKNTNLFTNKVVQ